MFHYIDGGSDDEWTLRRNTTAFDDYQLWPNQLRLLDEGIDRLADGAVDGEAGAGGNTIDEEVADLVQRVGRGHAADQPVRHHGGRHDPT